MAPPKKIIALSRNGDDQYEICLFRREGKNKWHLINVLVHNAPQSSIKAKEKMKELSEKFQFPWQKKVLQDVTRKRLLKAEKRKIQREIQQQSQLIARAKKPALLTFDGTSKGRPGVSAAAGVIEMPDFTRHTATKFIASATASEAEYIGLIIGLEKAKELGISNLEIRGDNQMVIYQVSGKYRIKSETKHLEYYEQVLNLLSFFDNYSLSWIPRQKNQLAHRAARKCLQLNSPLDNCLVDNSKSSAIEYVDYLISGGYDWYKNSW